MQWLNVILHSLNQLCLILSDGTTDVRTHKESIEAWEDTEHLVGIPSCTKLVTKTSSDASLHTVNALIIPEVNRKNKKSPHP